ncbi:MAG: Hsp20/alpha crystallin family protein [Clostridia bacterium]|nr:Hsp20/alpha crystallin family protein [Clostridia bacterium]
MKHYVVKRNNGTNDFFGGFFDDFFRPTLYNMDSSAMKTDVKENENDYTLDVEMPGYNKEDISVQYENGYLSVSAKREEKEENGKYLRKERSVSCSRTYYVGEVEEEQIKAKFENGVLSLVIPKEVEKLPEKHTITIA